MHHTARRWLSAVALAAGLWAWGLQGSASAGLVENQVLIVYNSQNADSLAIYNHYLSVHPAVHAVDLNDAALAAGNISYADFETKIRDKVRTYLSNHNLEEQVHALTLTKGLPHRITDINGINGDRPNDVGTPFVNGNVTYASVDSELTLLWQDLDAGEAGGTLDSAADNLILNPYHGSTSAITSYDRSTITSAKSFDDFADLGVIQVMQDSPLGPDSDAGSLYLVTRLDGNTAAQVISSIDRAQNVSLNRLTDRILIDENDANLTGGQEYDDTAFLSPKNLDPSYQGNDYEELAAAIAGQYDAVTLDQGTSFLIGTHGTVGDANKLVVTDPVAALITFGGNHNGNDQNGYLATFDGQIVPGAVFVSLESYSGRPFGGLTEFSDQGSVAEWIAAGGTFGIGNVFEPFAPSLVDAELLMQALLLNGMTWAEAAWSAMPYLSWQQVVVGDPLATVTVVIPEPGAAGAMMLGLACGAMGRRRR